MYGILGVLLIIIGGIIGCALDGRRSRVLNGQRDRAERAENEAKRELIDAVQRLIDEKNP